ncbi:MAG: cell wall-binding repeat-containing protein, partial [Coriobacteriia bacterium]|nr:cell wall-binding repeat-containing protein [Coriobacteriia bacterium]
HVDTDSVLILGGTGAVSKAVEDDLKVTFGDLAVERLAGVNRYATAVAVATYGVDHCGLAWNSLAFATGTNFPDALSGGVLQGRDGSVMLLTNPFALSDEPEAVLRANKASINEVKFLGGLGAVSQAVRDQVIAALE